MDHPRHRFAVAIVLAAIGCGPPAIGAIPSESTDSGDSETTSTTSTSTSTTDSETSSDEITTDERSTAGFVPDKDVWTLEECDEWLQDCPEGEKCVPYSSTGGTWDANKCVPIMGDQAQGEPCWYGGAVEATDNCDETSLCWDVMNVDGEAIGTCLSFCTGSPDNPECQSGASCLVDNNSVFNICIPGCDPVLQDCGPGLACFWANGNFNCIFTTEEIPPGEPCGFINDCAAGSGCLTAELLPSCAGEACCTPFCSTEQGDAQCEALPGTSCLPFFEEWQAPPGYEIVGMCMLP